MLSTLLAALQDGEDELLNKKREKNQGLYRFMRLIPDDSAVVAFPGWP